MVSPTTTTIISPTKTTQISNEEQQQQQTHDPDAFAHQSQSHNSKSNNGHCIVDGSSPNNPSVIDGGTQVTPVHHSAYEIANIDDATVIDTYQGDDINTDIVLKNDSIASITEQQQQQQQPVNVVEPTTIAIITTGKTPTESETTSSTDDTDLGTKKYAPTDASGINGPANDLRV